MPYTSLTANMVEGLGDNTLIDALVAAAVPMQPQVTVEAKLFEPISQGLIAISEQYSP